MSRSLLPDSLSGRLAVGGIAWIGAWALSLLLAFNLLLSNVLAGQLDTALRARAEAVRETVHVNAGRWQVTEGADAALDAGTSIYRGRVLVEGVDLSPELTADLVQVGDRVADREVVGPVRYLALPIESGGVQVGTVVVSSDLGARSRTQWIVGTASVVLIVLLLVFTFFALRGTVARAMRPVRLMGEQAATWSEAEIDRRFDPQAGPLELRTLAATLNGLLERIGATLRHERQFTAELSHELRTPLAHLHAQADLLAGGGTAAVTQQDLDDLLVSVRRLEGLALSALAPARARQHAPGLASVREIVEGLPGQVQLAGDLDLVVALDVDVARRALLPVVENACRYARSVVRVEATRRGAAAVLTVVDDGGALPADLAERVFEPGFRATPGDGHAGAGLGLALTRRICRAAGGEVTASVEAGWTVLTLTLPALSAPAQTQRKAISER